MTPKVPPVRELVESFKSGGNKAMIGYRLDEVVGMQAQALAELRREFVDALVTVQNLGEDLLEARDVADDLAAIVRTLQHDGDLGPQGVAALNAWKTAWEHDD